MTFPKFFSLCRSVILLLCSPTLTTWWHFSFRTLLMYLKRQTHRNKNWNNIGQIFTYQRSWNKTWRWKNALKVVRHRERFSFFFFLFAIRMFWVLNYHEINPADSCCSCSSFKWKRWPSAYWQASVRASIFDNQTSIIPNKLFITDLPGRRRSWCICFACSLTSLCLSPSILRRRRVFAARLGGWGDNSSSPAAPSQTELSTNPSSVTPHADLSNSPQVLFRTLLLLMNSSLSQPDSNVRKMTAFCFF